MTKPPLFAALVLLAAAGPVDAGSFTYRGQLNEDGVAANGRYDLQLQLYADPSGTRPLAAPIDLADVAVKDGQFAVAVELPDLLADTAWLEVSVRPEGEYAYWPLGAKENVALKGAVCPAAWELGGNAGTVEGSSFLGTTDSKRLELRSNNLSVARFLATGTADSAAVQVTLGAPSNAVSALASSTTIAGGMGNVVNDNAGTIGGGQSNTVGEAADAADSQWATIAGGQGNSVTGAHGTIAGGRQNDVRGAFAFIGGGSQNLVTGSLATVVGGNINTATAPLATISGGLSNRALGEGSMVAGGFNNCSGGNYSWTGGRRAGTRSGTESVGSCGTASGTPGGDQGTFVWADSQDVAFVSTGEDQFLVRARGGVGINAPPIADAVELSVVADADDSDTANLFLRQRSTNAGILFSSSGATSTGDNNAAFFIDHFNGGAQSRRFALNSDGSVLIRSNVSAGNSGVSMAAGSGAWSALSDRNVKTAISAVDPGAILDRLVSIPISEWSYIAQGEGVRHLGPMAQDFAAAFGLGENTTTISSIDADGVALAAIQGLNTKLERENAALRATVDRLSAEMTALRSAVEALRANQEH